MEKSQNVITRENFKAVGKIVALEDIRNYDEEDDATKVLNFTIEYSDIEDIDGIEIPITKESRIAIFHTLAVKGANSLELGKHVLLTDCTEQLRPFVNKEGQTRKMLSTVANQINVISEDIYNQVKDKVREANKKVASAPDFR